MTHTPSQSEATLSSPPSPPRSHSRPSPPDLEKQPSNLAHRDRPHHQHSFSPSRDHGDLRTTLDEAPLETGSPYLPPSTSAAHPAEIESVFTPSHPTLSTFSLLVFATIWGILVRLGLIWIGGFAERDVFALIWAQGVGCAVMGFVVERKKGIERVFPPMFIMCGTAFCGSLTTWSSMSHDVFSAFANLDQPAGTSRFAGFLSGLGITLLTLSVAMSSLQLGVHLSSFIPPIRLPLSPPPGRSSQRLFNTLTLVLGPLFWLGAVFLAAFGPSSWRSRATFAIVFAPPGSIVRYYLSKQLNSRHPSLPYGTLLINSLSVLLFAVLALLSRRSSILPSSTSCAALKGLQDGFCGALSTISTMAVELRGLKRGESWRYWWVSWGVAQGLMVVVLGSWVWSGERDGVCWMR